MPREKSIAEERIKPGAWLPPWTVDEHKSRYEFSAQYAENRRIVDCACGNGVGTRVFIRANPLEVHGFDLDDDAVQFASKHLKKNNVTFTKGSALSLPLPEASVDLYISLETIEHIDDDAGFVSEISRVLKPDGLLILSTPNRLITNPGARLQDRPWNHFHVREYAPSELEAVLGKHFEIQDWYGQNKNIPLKVALFEWVANSLGKKSAVILNQILKCRWFLLPNKKRHHVAATARPGLHEYLVVVCRRKKANSEHTFQSKLDQSICEDA